MDKKENIELFKKALVEAVNIQIDRMIEESKDVEVPEKTKEEKEEYIKKIIQLANEQWSVGGFIWINE